jgi:hypothetical protein
MLRARDAMDRAYAESLDIPEFSEEPTEHPYGIDCGLRDPFGNHLRIVQLANIPQEVPARKS